MLGGELKENASLQKPHFSNAVYEESTINLMDHGLISCKTFPSLPSYEKVSQSCISFSLELHENLTFKSIIQSKCFLSI